MTRVEQLRDLETAKQVASLLEAENARLHQRLEALVAENARLKGEDAQARLQLELEGLEEQPALLHKRFFGASSEKRVEKTAKPPRAKPQRDHGPTAQPELKVQEVLLPLDEAQKVCGLCGGGLHAWEGQTEDCEEVT
jgi:transposase